VQPAPQVSTLSLHCTIRNFFAFAFLQDVSKTLKSPRLHDSLVISDADDLRIYF